ncbi:MAG: energy transducer TonB [Ignavibacteriales bacterium]|nr:energy transducer TonB [Ignavibacteriales bacterium]
MTITRVFFTGVIILCFITIRNDARQSRPEILTIDPIKPSNLVLTGDSAFFSRDAKKVKKHRKMKDTSDAPPYEGIPLSQQPTFLKMIIPKCPKEAIIKSMTGTTKVKVWVDEHGNPRLAVIMESSDKIFNECSLISAMQWTFKPAMNDNKPTSSWMYIPFRFRNCK